MRLMDQVLIIIFFYKFVVVYFENILIYSIDVETQLEHLRMIMEVLRKNNLNINLKKYSFLIWTLWVYSWCSWNSIY